jgi:integrase
MSIYRPKGSKVWVMDFFFHSQRIRESTGMTSKTRAKEVYEKRKQSLRDGTAGIRRQSRPDLLSTASAEWQQAKQMKWSPKMRDIAKCSLAHLLPGMGKRLLVDIEARDIAKYQAARLAEGASNRTINIEIGLLRQIMRKSGTWARIQPEVHMLKEREDCGRALTAEEERLLLLECGRSHSRILLPFVVLALDTGARFNTVRTVQWKNIDFANRCLKFGKDKTAAGSFRTVPLNPRAVATLEFWAQQFPDRESDHYVFPSEKCNQAGRENSFGFTGEVVYQTDPTRPIGDVKRAWETAKKRTRRHCPNCKTGILADKPKPEAAYFCIECKAELQDLPAGLVSVRFHDLRHSAVSRMIAARVPIPMVAKIVGWTAGTMAKMAARYGHFGIEELRGAVEAISRNSGAIGAGYPQFPPQSDSQNNSQRPN